MRCASLVVVVMLFSATAFARKWTDSSGTYTIDAEYRGVEDDQVILDKRGGKTIRVPLSKMSSRDQDYVWARRSLKGLLGAAGMENAAALAEAFQKTVAEFLRASAADQAETDVKRELAKTQRHKDLEAALRRVCDRFAGKPLTMVFPITDVRRAKYVPNVPSVMPGGIVVVGPRWIPAGPDDYELLVGPLRGQYAAEIKSPRIHNVKLSEDQALAIGRDCLWVFTGAARLQPGEARLAEGRLVVQQGPPPVAAIAVSDKTRPLVSGGILIYLDNQRVELKHGSSQEKPPDVNKPAISPKRRK